MATKTIRRRPNHAGSLIWPEHVSPVLQRIYMNRGMTSPADLELKLSRLLSPASLGSIDTAATLMAEAIKTDKRITVSGDYDCDGATGSATAVRGLKLLGAKHVKFIVPNRFVHGYGLSPELVDAMDPSTEVIVTVDSGVSSNAGVSHAKAKGMTVVVTDHHLPGETLPEADAIVNPNLQGDAFPSKYLAGVGVMFYLLIALRAKLRDEGYYGEGPLPDLTTLLDYVAIGTVADLVPLDANNRILVTAGLRRIREGSANPGVLALVDASGRDPTRLAAGDIGFSVAPRLNAAGRLENMSLGVETLLCDSYEVATQLTKQLDAINQERRDLQATMVSEAETMVAEAQDADGVGVVVFNPSWHAGVVGLVASKLKENLHRPVVAFAPGGEGSDKANGSGRSIEGFHLRDALAEVDVKCPGMLLKFGGHAMAAGLSLYAKDIPRFAEVFNEVATAKLDEERLQAVILTDGELPAGQINMDMAYEIRNGGPWGQAFPEPVFDGEFEIHAWRVMGNGHLKLYLRDPRDGTMLAGVMFHAFDGTPPPLRVRIAYELSINVWNNQESLQLLLRHMEPL